MGAAGAVGPAPGVRPQHRRRVRAVPRKAPSRVASRRLNSGSEPETRQILRAAILGIEGHSCSRLHRAPEFREPAEGKGGAHVRGPSRPKRSDCIGYSEISVSVKKAV